MKNEKQIAERILAAINEFERSQDGDPDENYATLCKGMKILDSIMKDLGYILDFDTDEEKTIAIKA